MNNEIENSQEEIRKCLNLWRAVVSLSIQDFLIDSMYYSGHKPKKQKALEDYKKAKIRYIHKSDDFVEVCKLAGLNSDYIRKKLIWMYNDEKVKFVKNQLKGNNTRTLRTFLTDLYDYNYGF